MEIKFDAETAATIASAAIFDSLLVEQRESIIKQAIQALLHPEKKGSWDTAKSPLQQAFDQAIREAAYKAVKELIENDTVVQENIHTLLGPLLASALEAEGKEYGTSLADALGVALGTWLSEQARKAVKYS